MFKVLSKNYKSFAYAVSLLFGTDCSYIYECK